MYLHHGPSQNKLLAALPEADFKRLFPVLELTQVSFGELIHDAAIRGEYVYFPTTAVVSLFCCSNGSELPQAAIVGNDGAVGISQLFVGKIQISRAVVQCTGYAYRMKMQHVRAELNRSGALLRLLLDYVQTSTEQMAKGSQLIAAPAFAVTVVFSDVAEENAGKHNEWFGLPTS